MKLALFNENRTGLLEGDNVVDITDILSASGFTGSSIAMIDVVANFDMLRERIEQGAPSCPRLPLSEVRLRAPLPRPGKVLAMGSNYLEGTEGPPLPIWAFFKSPDAIIGPEETINLPPVDARIFHHEGELVAIIGKKGKNIAREDAAGHVFGYTAGIDVSGRFPVITNSIFNKSHDSFAPIGPWIVTADEIADPHSLRVRLWVDDQLRQDFNTSDMGHTIWDSIAYLSGVTTLHPGDLIFTGTNHQGLGALQDGERVKIDIEKIGWLRLNVTDPLKRSWPKAVDQEIGARVITMIKNKTPPGSH